MDKVSMTAFATAVDEARPMKLSNELPYLGGTRELSSLLHNVMLSGTLWRVRCS